MAALPNDLALTTIPDGTQIIAATHRNNYASVQAAVNALRDALANGSLGQLLQATDGTHIGYTTAAYPTTAGTAGNVLRSDGTNLLSAILGLTDVGAGTQHTLALSGASKMGSLAAGAAGQLLQSQGASADPAWVTPGYSGVFDVVNTSTVTTIFSQVIPANYIGANGALDIVIAGDYLNNTTTTQTLTLQMSFGGTLLFQSTTAAIAKNVLGRAVNWSGILANENATNAQRLTGYGSISEIGAAGWANNEVAYGGFRATATVDTTSAQTLLVQAQLSNLSPNHEFKGSVHVAWRP